MEGRLRQHAESTLRASLGGVLLGVALGATACSDAPRPPDVILLSLDSVRADELTFRDPEVAPRLTALAEGGTVFTRAVAGSSWTLASHAQMFTGQPPQLHGVQDDERNIDPLTKTLPECLAERGYATVGVWSGWFLAGEYGFARGFDHYESALESPGPPAASGRDGDESARQDFIRREHSSHRQITSRRLLELALSAVDEVPDSEPLFLFGHFFDPHYDYIPPEPYDTRFDPGYEGDIDGRDFWGNKRIFDPDKSPMRQIDDRDLAHVRALYRGEVAWTDGVIGELLDALRARGRLDEALILVTSDHGEEFFEHGNRGHRQGLYEEVLRVPLLVVPPASGGRAAAPNSVDALVSLSDLMPTILDAIGAEVPGSVFGRSLWPLVQGTEPGGGDPRFVVSTLTTRVESAEGSATLVMDALHTGTTKLIRQVRIPTGGEPGVESVHWFDLASDPAELRPRRNVDRHPEVAGAWARLELELERMREHHARLPHAPPEERRTDVREIFAADLGALGYAEGPDGPAPDGEARWTLAPLPPLPPE